MASRYLQNDSPALKRKSARFRGVGRECLLIFLAEDGAKAALSARCGCLWRSFFYFAKKQSLTGAGLYCML